MSIRILLPLTALIPVGAANAQLPAELKGHSALIHSVAFRPDGQRIATAGYDNLVKIWDAATRQPIKFKDPAGKEIDGLVGHTGPVYGVAWSPDGKMLASSSVDKSIRLWNPDDGKPIREIKGGHTDIVISVAFSPDGKYLASGSADKTVRLWNPADGKEVKNLGAQGASVYSVAFSPDSKYLATGSADKLAKIWDVAGQKVHKELKGHDEAVTGVAFSPDNTLLATTSQDFTLRVWQVAEGKEHKKFGPTTDYLFGLAWTKDGKGIATAGYSGIVAVWELDKDPTKPVWSKQYKGNPAYCVVVAPDGKTLLSGHDKNVAFYTTIGAP